MNPGLNLNNLKYFYDAVETESISESARRNFITQSAVSQGIQKLEKALGTSLITHQRNCFKLTTEGEQVFSLAKQIFITLKTMTDLAQESTDVISGQINLVCTQSIAINLISSILQNLKKEYPEVSVNMKVGKLENISLSLKRGMMDVGIVVESEFCDQFDKYVLKKGFFHVYVKNEKKQPISKGVYVDHSNGLSVDRLQSNFHKSFKKKLTILQELDSWQVLAKCAENEIGPCFLPDFVVDKNSKLIPHSEIAPIPYRIVAIYPKGVHLTRAAKTLLDLLLS